MKSIWNRFSNLILHGINGIPFDYYLFLFLFFSRMFELLIAGDIFSVYGTYEHEFLLFEKYTYFLTAGYLALYFAVYLIKNHKLPLNKTMCLSLLFFLTAVISTLINQGMDVRYDYYTKLALMELMMTVLFMFYTASRLNESQFRKLMRIAGKGLIYLVLFFNIISLIAYFAKPAADSIMILGRPVEIPKVFFDDRLVRMYYRYAGFYRNTQTLGEHCALAITLVIYLFEMKQLNKFTAILTIITGIILLALSSSRTGIIMTGCSAIVYSGYLIRKKSHRNKNLFTGYLVVLFLALAIGIYLLFKKAAGFYEAYNGDLFYTLDRISSSRGTIVMEVWNIFKVHPVIGEGWNVRILKYDSAHNFLLTTLAWTGLIGLTLMICLLVSVVVKCIKTRMIRNNILLFMIAVVAFIQCMLEQGILGDKLHSFTYLFWLVLGYFASDRTENITPSAVNG